MYSFSFTDFLNGDVKLVPVACNYLIGKNIRRFTNGSEEDSVNIFDESDLAELDKILSSICEVLKFLLLINYLNHDAKLL